MTYKQIEAAREARLWLSQIIIPTATAAVVIGTIPEVRNSIVDKIRDTKSKIKSTFSKKEEA